MFSFGEPSTCPHAAEFRDPFFPWPHRARAARELDDGRPAPGDTVWGDAGSDAGGLFDPAACGLTVRANARKSWIVLKKAPPVIPASPGRESPQDIGEHNLASCKKSGNAVIGPAIVSVKQTRSTAIEGGGDQFSASERIEGCSR
jgi:hypothetical protein